MKSNITFRLDSQLKEQFIEKAKSQGTTATALFHQWLSDYLSDSTNSTALTNSTNSVSADSTNDTDKLKAELEEQKKTINRIRNGLNELRDRAITKVDMEGVSCSLPCTNSVSADSTNTAPTKAQNPDAMGNAEVLVESAAPSGDESQKQFHDSTNNTIPTVETENESAIAHPPEKECQIYLVKTKNDSEPIELLRGRDFSCETNDPDDLMDAIQTYLFDSEQADPDDEDINIDTLDDAEAWKKANKGKGISLSKMGERLKGVISRNTIERYLEKDPRLSEEKREACEKEIDPHFYWCALTKRFYRL